MSVANLITAREALEAYIATMYTAPQPTYSVGGRSISWDAHHSAKVADLAALNEMILKRQGAVEQHSIVFG